ncbi:MAG: MBL fold metallo-hydrolase, partial [Actinobacteria bacterium]|nr:MBL fold metallo-hydrolase [Actinomycetota bacterium]
MLFRQITHDDLGCASYLVGDDDAGVAAVVDPRFEIDVYLDLARYMGVRIEHILETHNHADHVSGFRGDTGKIIAALAPEETPTRIVFLYDVEDSEAVYQAIVAGAFGLLPKSTEPDKLCDALLAAARGSTGISYELQTAFIAEMRLRRQGGPALLTGREREILHLTADGLSVGQIAERL